MVQETTESNKAGVPLYTKVGWGIAWIVMLGFAAMILRNCATSVIYGLKTDQQAIDASYQTGMKDGSSGQEENIQGETIENSVLRKAYIKGYRDGVDKERSAGSPRN
ncbi:MAG: hypothetical protein PHI06_10165 [Desulfobulbaceae bacterium]|nr:hypothetical protein [Desulfobulbaceae bacterium]